MKTAHYIIFAFIFIILGSCADTDNNAIQIGDWIATEDISRRDCNNEYLNGPGICPNDPGRKTSCVKLTLTQTGYVLSVSFDGNTTLETGTFNVSSGNIRMSPTEPVGVAYDLPIIASDFDSMTIEMARDNGCIVTIPMIRV